MRAVNRRLGHSPKEKWSELEGYHSTRVRREEVPAYKDEIIHELCELSIPGLTVIEEDQTLTI